MIRVGRSKYEGRRHPTYTYKDVRYGVDGWADAKKYLPIEFDMVMLFTKNHKVLFGWSTGTDWDGLRIDIDEDIIAWKREPQERIEYTPGF